MRPPLSATPPVSHVISRQFQPTPALSCREDWRNLTSNNSIQILSLETSECHEESQFHNADVSNQLRFVETIISPRHCDAFSWYDRANRPDSITESVAETLVSLDSLTHHHGDTLDARIIFTPKEQYTVRQNLRFETNTIPEGQNLESAHRKHQLNRNCYSDSSIGGLGKDKSRLAATVSRTKSLSYAENIRKKNNTGLVDPLLPCVNKSKVGGVKRIPSFRDVPKRVSNDTTQTLKSAVKPKLVLKQINVNDTVNRLPINPAQVVKRKCDIVAPSEGYTVANANEDKERNFKTEGQKSKVERLVKNGLKSVAKSSDHNVMKCVMSSSEMKRRTLFERQRRRKSRCNTDIGGLSDFLRRNERRKTVEVILETVTDEKIQECAYRAQDDTTCDTLNLHNYHDAIESNSRLTPIEETKTPKPDLGSRRLHAMGTSNLNFNHCQRRLVCQSNHSSAKSNMNFDPIAYAETYVCNRNGTDSQTLRRPRLGLFRSSWPNNVLSIDELEMNLVQDLKRQVERTVRSTRIKTNGSLKMKTRNQMLHKPTTSSPRRYRCNGPATFCHSVRHVHLKRESIV